MKYSITTLGCKVNQYETQAIETMLQERGYNPAQEDGSADVVIINTCAVTAEAGANRGAGHPPTEEPQPVQWLRSAAAFPGQPSGDGGAWRGYVFGSGDRKKLVEETIALLRRGRTGPAPNLLRSALLITPLNAKVLRSCRPAPYRAAPGHA